MSNISHFTAALKLAPKQIFIGKCNREEVDFFFPQKNELFDQLHYHVNSNTSCWNTRETSLRWWLFIKVVFSPLIAFCSLSGMEQEETCDNVEWIEIPRTAKQ